MKKSRNYTDDLDSEDMFDDYDDLQGVKFNNKAVKKLQKFERGYY